MSDRRLLLNYSALPGTMPVVAVLGGAGFIGSHLCRELSRSGRNVYCIDNFYTGRTQNLRGHSLSSVNVIRHDVLEPLPESLPKFDEIYNLACPASPPHYQADRVRTALVCAMGAKHVLERASRDGAKVLQASTSEVYGDPEVHPQVESYHGNVNTVGPRSCYDEGKRFAETLFTDFGRQHGVAVKIARIFNTYGPNMQPDDGRVVSNFIVQALRGESLTLYGDGAQTRSLCYVSDLVGGLMALMASDDEVCAPVNLGNPREMTVREIADVVLDLTGSESTLTHRPLPKDDPQRRRPDIDRAQALLGWSPKVDLRDGLTRTIKYFREDLRQDIPGSAAIAAAGLRAGGVAASYAE